MNQKIYLVSACLLGLCTRYDAKLKTSDACLARVAGHTVIPVCPEQLGGLATPRTAADLIGGTGTDVIAGRAKVISKTGDDVTAKFILGAQQVLQIARAQAHIDGIFLKSRSPSCGVHEKQGVTTALLLANGYSVEEF